MPEPMKPSLLPQNIKERKEAAKQDESLKRIKHPRKLPTDKLKK